MDEPNLRATLADLDRNLLERDGPVRLLLLAALAGEHVLLIGPPGTAKSELARRLHAAFVDAPYFERLLTRFSVPEELFGPLSLTALEQDRYERLTAGFLPTAQVAFLDEVFKANSAILNALLTLLNEREFDNGAGRVRVPLVSVVGATNEVPEDESLQAFHDRFLLRVPVQPVGDAHFAALLALPAQAEPGRPRLRAADLQPLRERARAVVLPDAVTTLLVQARAWCAQQAVTVSDRRWRKLVGLLQVQAASRGAVQVGRWDLWLLPYALGARPEQIQALVQWCDETVGQAVPLDLQWLARAARAFEKQLEIETTAQPDDAADDGAGKLALARAIAGEVAGHDSAMLRIVSERARRRYSQRHVDARVAQVAEVQQRCTAALQSARQTARAALAGARDHLWLPPGVLARIAAVHDANVDLARGLQDELQALAQGFAELPVDAALHGRAPEPLQWES
ncbi:MAG: AAA family ATPase [Burkholderiaceae bacterium]|nr:AAA family ATPase [Rhodoferax sp.]MCB2008058.1 AAA family ATPase [Rhodoferax sp.]MCB2027340.1 AAA family ATPase [Rhodoferax sp.]MCP5263114.1 AAA family ATPase [Rhodoferax sp.]MCW5628258.1 AAA family ATPase [Rhodoferax sp.]